MMCTTSSAIYAMFDNNGTNRGYDWSRAGTWDTTRSCADRIGAFMSRRALGRRSSAELPSVSVGSRISADTSARPALADHVHRVSMRWRLPTVLSRCPHRFYVSTPTSHMSACRAIGRERLVTRVSWQRRSVACSLSPTSPHSSHSTWLEPRLAVGSERLWGTAMYCESARGGCQMVFHMVKMVVPLWSSYPHHKPLCDVGG